MASLVIFIIFNFSFPLFYLIYKRSARDLTIHQFRKIRIDPFTQYAYKTVRQFRIENPIKQNNRTPPEIMELAAVVKIKVKTKRKENKNTYTHRHNLMLSSSFAYIETLVASLLKDSNMLDSFLPLECFPSKTVPFLLFLTNFCF